MNERRKKIMRMMVEKAVTAQTMIPAAVIRGVGIVQPVSSKTSSRRWIVATEDEIKTKMKVVLEERKKKGSTVSEPLKYSDVDVHRNFVALLIGKERMKEVENSIRETVAG